VCDFDHFSPHREVEPVRHCADCGCLLSSANETKRCWACGGWIELANWWEQRESFAELMAAEPELVTA